LARDANNRLAIIMTKEEQPMRSRREVYALPLRMICRLVVVFSALTIASGLSGRTTATSAATPVCPLVSCTYLPVVQIQDLVAIDEHHWLSGTSQYDYNLFHGVGGRIYNISDQPVYDIVIAAQYWEASGGVTTTVIMTGETALHRTAVGANNLFYVPAPRTYEADELPEYQLTVRSVQVHPPKSYQPVTVVSYVVEQCCDPFASKVLTVTLRNDNPQAVSAVKLAVRAASNRFIVESVVSTMAPGEQYTARYSYDYRMPIQGPFGAEGIGVTQ
jgi:hypothetical protein